MIDVVFVGRMKHCIRCIGMEERIDLAKVIRPAIVNILDFHEDNLEINL